MECANYKGALEYAFERMRTGPFTRMRTGPFTCMRTDCISHLFNLVADSSLLVSCNKVIRRVCETICEGPVVKFGNGYNCL